MQSILELISLEPAKESRWVHKYDHGGTYIFTGTTKGFDKKEFWYIFRYIPNNSPNNSYDVIYIKEDFRQYFSPLD